MNAPAWPRHRPELPAGWWLQHPGYFRYMMRELTCVPIGAWVALAIVGLFRLGQGASACDAFVATLGTPWALLLQAVALAFAVYHSLTWFALAPRPMPLQIGARRVPPGWIAGAHYLAWAVVSLVLLLLAGV